MWKLVLAAAVLFPMSALFAAEPEPVLLVTRDACFVHSLPAWPDADGAVERVVAPGHLLLHTARPTGRMTRLGEPTGIRAISTRRLSFVVQRVLGVAADADRLYVLRWSNRRLRDRAPEEDATIEGGRYELRVYWLEDAAVLEVPPLAPDGLPTAAGPPCLDAGPLHLVPDGVSCFGTTIRYDGRALR